MFFLVIFIRFMIIILKIGMVFWFSYIMKEKNERLSITILKYILVSHYWLLLNSYRLKTAWMLEGGILS